MDPCQLQCPACLSAAVLGWQCPTCVPAAACLPAAVSSASAVQLVRGCRGCTPSNDFSCLFQASVTCAITAPIQIPDYKAIAGDKEV